MPAPTPVVIALQYSFAGGARGRLIDRQSCARCDAMAEVMYGTDCTRAYNTDSR